VKGVDLLNVDVGGGWRRTVGGRCSLVMCGSEIPLELRE
jgi:hypothetical protein